MSKYGILGWPLERSYSPVIHTFLLKHASIEGKYELIKMNEINNKNIDAIIITGGTGNSFMHDLECLDPLEAAKRIINGK